jgi:hypothetical protein
LEKSTSYEVRRRKDRETKEGEEKERINEAKKGAMLTEWCCCVADW